MAKDNMKKEGHSWGGYIYSAHLYNSKAEALFKAVAISVSWVGGFWNAASTTAYYLFSMAIIMEYAVQVVTTKKIVPKILPFLLIMSNLAVFLASTGQLLNAKSGIFEFQYGIEIFTMVIIWIDTMLTVLVEPPAEGKVETSLSQRG